MPRRVQAFAGCEDALRRLLEQGGERRSLDDVCDTPDGLKAAVGEQSIMSAEDTRLRHEKHPDAVDVLRKTPRFVADDVLGELAALCSDNDGDDEDKAFAAAAPRFSSSPLEFIASSWQHSSYGDDDNDEEDDRDEDEDEDEDEVDDDDDDDYDHDINDDAVKKIRNQRKKMWIQNHL